MSRLFVPMIFRLLCETDVVSGIGEGCHPRATTWWRTGWESARRTAGGRRGRWQWSLGPARRCRAQAPSAHTSRSAPGAGWAAATSAAAARLPAPSTPGSTSARNPAPVVHQVPDTDVCTRIVRGCICISSLAAQGTRPWLSSKPSRNPHQGWFDQEQSR